MDNHFTILGASGWIGSNLVSSLRKLPGVGIEIVNRKCMSRWLSANTRPSHIIYAVGMTANFREKPFETVDAHVTLLAQVLKSKKYSPLCYLSSTRVYAGSNTSAEYEPLVCLSTDHSDIYNISKLMGESLVLTAGCPGSKIVRLSNVIGADQPRTTFYGSLLDDIQQTGSTTILQAPNTSKDYVRLEDVVNLIPKIFLDGKFSVYNLASGRLTSHLVIAKHLQSLNAMVKFSSSPDVGLSFMPIDIKRLVNEFYQPLCPFS